MGFIIAVSQNIKAPDRWSEYHWFSHYNALGRHKDLSDFGKGRFVLATQLGLNLSRIANLFCCSQFAGVLPTKRVPVKDNQ